MPYAESGGGSSYGGDSHWGGGGSSTTKKKRKKDWRDAVLTMAEGPAALGLERTPWGFTQGLGHVIGALGTSPLQALLFPKEVPGQVWGTVRGTVEGPYAFGKMMRPTERGGGGMDFREASGLMLESMKEDYKSRYGADWKEHARDNSLFNLFDALSVVGMGARTATMIGAAGRLGVGERGLVNLWKESSRPGLLTGGERDRIVRYQPDTGPEMTSTQPWSRSPVRRGTQAGADIISERFPNAPVFGAAARVTRAQGNQLGRVIERTIGRVHGEEELNKLSDAGRSRLFWESQLGTSDDGTLIKLRNALEKEYDSPDTPDANPEFREIMREAKQAGFGKGVLLKRLDAAIDFDTTDHKGYATARDALRQMTVLTEHVIADSHGFGSLKQDLKRVSDRMDGLEPQSEEWLKAVTERTRLRQELAGKEGDLETMFRNRRSIVRDWLDTKGTNEYADAWHEVLTAAWGEDKADQAIAYANSMANKIRPDNPESWWADKVGKPSREGAAVFRERVGDDALFQFGEEAGLLDSGFYSPAQKWALENFDEPMPVEDLRTALLEASPKEELYNSGLDMWFDSLPEGTIVKPQEFKTLLANRVNAYNFRQVIRSNTPDAADAGLGTIYDYERGEGTYISRGDVRTARGEGLVPREGEYFEVTFELPGRGIDNAAFMDKNRHWGRENVAVHFRFHIFEEDGVRKLLVEEIQSDWANEARVQRQEGRVYRNPTDAEQREIDDLRNEIDDLGNRSRELKERQEELDAEIRNGIKDNEDEWYANQDEIDDLDNQWWDLNRGFNFLDEQFGLGNIPPAPLSGSSTAAASSYLNSPVRWIARHAVEQNVDEVILVSREVQMLRNAKAVPPREWLSLQPQGSEAVTAWLKENPADNVSFKSYEKDIPKLMGREFGVKGVRSESAYVGEYRVPHNTGMGARGQMPGTVFKVDKTFREKAMLPKSMYQRTPDWNALPKGAVEMLNGGKSRLHIFKDGDMSTWIHELGHVALDDLAPEELKTVETHFFDGKSYREGTELQHETYARAFEQFVREGVAPTRALQPVFAKIAAWIKAVWEREKRVNPDLPPEVRAAFSSLFKSADEPDIFIPHRAAEPDLGGGRSSRGIPRANREIGDRTVSRIPLFAKNKLGLMRSGMLYDDPRVLVEHMNRVVALARANQLREAVLEMGRPLLPNEAPNFDTQYVVKRAGRGVDKPYYDALESADDPAEIRSTIQKYIDDHITDDAQLYEEWQGEAQLYVVDKKPVDLLFKHVTGKAPGAATKPVTNTSRVIDATLDSFRGLLLYANPGFYVTNILGNTGMMMFKDPASIRYMPWSINQAMKAAVKPGSADRLWERISIEMGRGRMTGNFSEQSMREIITPRPGSETNVAGGVAEKVSASFGEWGRRSGRVIDDSFRVSAWRQSAAKMGYRTDAQVEKLLEEGSHRPFKGKMLQAESKAAKDLNKIRDEAEQLMLDFDSISPWERTYLQRALFLYPFLKASTKYPFMFAGERPITSGVLFGATGQGEKFAEREDVLGPRPELPGWLSGYGRGPFGYVNVGSFSPFNMPPQLLESVMHLRGGAREEGAQTPLDYINPVFQLALDMARQQNQYGREVPSEEILRTELPLPGWMAYPFRKPSDRWKERDFWNTLLRSLRAAPVGINEGE